MRERAISTVHADSQNLANARHEAHPFARHRGALQVGAEQSTAPPVRSVNGGLYRNNQTGQLREIQCLVNVERRSSHNHQRGAWSSGISEALRPYEERPSFRLSGPICPALGLDSFIGGARR